MKPKLKIFEIASITCGGEMCLSLIGTSSPEYSEKGKAVEWIEKQTIQKKYVILEVYN
jgi:hypothetical protein